MLQKFKAGLLFVVIFFCLLQPLRAQVLPLEQKNTISTDWMVQNPASGQLVPYIAGEHANYNAVHQWLFINPRQPFLIDFAAKQNLCLYLNNKLIFLADSTANYTLDLSAYSKGVDAVQGKYLLTAWHPAQQPLVSTYKNHLPEQSTEQRRSRFNFTRLSNYPNHTAFVVFVLLIGLLYGSLRTNFTADFQNIYNPGIFFKANKLEEGTLAKPITSWSSILFVIAFSLSMALLIVAIHTNVQQVQFISRLFPVSEADIITRILFYTAVVFVFILLKYLFLKVMGFIFELEQVVHVQYNEFIRTILFLGIFLPFIMLLYLGLNTSQPQTILLVSSLAVSLLLIITTLRVFITVNKKATVLNLHLFSYLCATEVIPLAVVLKLIVF
ncbi:DUF4271 domain-containing protein [Pontibacter sp. SGAir0037]|uniref:DUF4271 domain-containing protein n=1 Tax=Pontibacter sp. SGAir0037 TaxID=2571030 RepID=UPI0010CCBAF1|nr:DUF4271 domain-containing protein [Pontibacter sp. SGAir0037]QCR24182.1 DUF4271 domain-containing protein [Pontibacter sp. SGAir0037]